MEAGTEVKISYYEGDNIRGARGRLVEETPESITVDLNKFRVTIFKTAIIKIEVLRPGATWGYNNMGDDHR